MKNLFAAAFIFFTSFQSFADCAKPVTSLKEGTTAPCTGYLFSPEKELEVRLKVSTYGQMEDLVKRNEELNNILNNRVENLHKLNAAMIEREQSRENQDTLVKLGYFALGVIVTGFIATNVGR
jgi:response regulator RpfG family c-di-GMP phosphodiesterase